MLFQGNAIAGHLDMISSRQHGNNYIRFFNKRPTFNRIDCIERKCLTVRMTIDFAFHHIKVSINYAHHPAELTAALAAARSQATGRLIVLFQPHMPWRTRQFAAEFAAALLQADPVVLLETYLARGAPDADASAQRIADRIVAADGPPVELALDGAAAADRLRAITRSGDLLICCGAGPVDAVARAVLA